jgi:LPXTG-site transpeptidase (sortase) family protein
VVTVAPERTVAGAAPQVTSTAVIVAADRPAPPRLVSEGWFRDQTPRPTPVPQVPPTAVHELLPITGLKIPSASIDTQVVEAPTVDEPDGSISWQVPKFVAGHAESTASAGQSGNAVLFGHVTSQTLGNVFENLHDTHLGDVVEVMSGDHVFTYRVVDIRAVPRTDSSVIDTADTPMLTLITCTGLWNPLLHDYMERLVVQARLVTGPARIHVGEVTSRPLRLD